MKNLIIFLSFLVTVTVTAQSRISAPLTETDLADSTAVVLNENRRTKSVRLDSIRNFFKTYFDTIYGSGGLTNPLTEDLNLGGHNILSTSTIAISSDVELRLKSDNDQTALGYISFYDYNTEMARMDYNNMSSSMQTNLGSDNTIGARLSLFGGANAYNSGSISLFNGNDYDTTVESYTFYPEGDFKIYTTYGQDYFVIDDATGGLTAPLTDLADYAVLGDKTIVTDERLQDYVSTNSFELTPDLKLGDEDTTNGSLTVHGNSTTTGGKVIVENPADNDTEINNYSFETINGNGIFKANGGSNGSAVPLLTFNKTTLQTGFGNYEFPRADGAAGQVLTTDGSGQVTFEDVYTYMVTPSQFTGTDREKIVSAITEAQSRGLNKIYIFDDYTISRGIDLPSNFEVVIDGSVSLVQPSVYNLTADSGTITANTKTVFLGTYNRTDNRDYTVTDATGLEVGMLVTFFDDSFPKMFYPHTNRRGLVAIITAIDGNTVTIDRDFTNWLTSTTVGNDLFLTSENARLVPTDFVFRMDNKTNVKISGTGTINGNRPNDDGILDVANDVNVEPVNDEWNEEDYTYGAGCTLAVLNDSEDIVVEGVTIQKGFTHNLRFREVDGFRVSNTVIEDAHDKNFLLHYCDNGIIENNEVRNALFEDGIISYIYNKNLKINNNYVHGNPRYGIAIQRYSTDCTTTGNTISFNGQNFNVATRSGFTSNNDIVEGGRMGTYRTDEYFEQNIALLIEGHNINFNNLLLTYPYNRATTSYPERENWQPIVIRSTTRNEIGVSKHITFNGGAAVNTWARGRNITTQEWTGSPYNINENFITFGGASGGSDYNIDGVSFNQFNFEGIPKGMLFYHNNETLAFTSIRFNLCTFKDSLFDTVFDYDTSTADEAAVTFINTDDYITGNYNGGVIANGQFDTDTLWTKGTGWTINTGSNQAECDGTQVATSLLQQLEANQADPLVIGETYLVKYDVTIAAGSIYPRLGYSGSGTPRSSIGSFTIIEEITCSGSTNFDFLASATFEGSIRNVSVIKISN